MLVMRTRRFKTLIVEDNDTYRETLKNLLSHRFPDMHLDEAKNGEQTLAKIKYFNPDLIFMDVVLPGQSGFEVTKKIRASGCDVVIIIMTSHDMPAYREASKKYGADHFVSKGASSASEIFALVDATISALSSS
jgi:DNA-binding NarL/FixJ family response regulator